MKVAFSLFLFTVSLLACGSGGSTSSGDFNPPGNTNLDGIWRGTFEETAENRRVSSLMYDGEIIIVTEDNVLYAGTYSATDGSFSASVHNNNEELAIAGTATGQNHIDGTYESSSGNTGNVTLQFNNDLYNRNSSFELLSGDWAGSVSNFYVNESGYFTGSIGPCHISGTFSLTDQECNLYLLDADISQCQ